MRWTGNGLSDGTTVSSGNVNTAGNGDTVVFQTSGTGGGVMSTAGDGFEVYGASTDIRRLDTTAFTATSQVATQLFYTPRQAPTSAVETLEVERSASATAASFYHGLSGGLGVVNAAGALLTTVPTLVNGHRYQIDRIVALSASPSTSNGRIIMRVVDLSDPTWNTTGDWFYDSGYAVNAGTAQMTAVRFGKTANGVIASGTPALLEQLGWTSVATTLVGVTTRSAVEAFFMASPYYTGTLAAAPPVVTATMSGTVAGASVTGDLLGSTPPPAGSVAGTVTDPVWTGTLSASPPLVTGSVAGLSVGPIFTGTLAASTPSTTGSATGTATAPVFTGTLAAATPKTTGSVAGTASTPTYTGTLVAPTPTTTGSVAGTVTAPAGSATLNATLPVAVGSMAGTTTPPTWSGTVTAATPPARAAISGITAGPVYSAVLTVALPPTRSTVTGTVTAPVVTSALAATSPNLLGSFVGVTHGDESSYRDVAVLAIIDVSRIISISDASRTVTPADTSRTVRVHDRST